MALVSSKKQLLGLDTHTNKYETKPGSTVIADNMVASRPGMLGNRKGFEVYASTSDTVLSFMEFEDGLIVHLGDDTLKYDDALDGTFTAYSGTYENAGSNTMRGAISEGSLYFTSSKGVMKLDAINGTPVRAGAPVGLDVQAAALGTGGGWLGSAQVAYKVVWTRTDSNGRTVTGAPSQPFIFTNTTQCTASSVARVGTTATFTATAAHGYATSDVITISGASQDNFNGSYTITVTGATTFTYTVANSGDLSATGTVVAVKKLNTTVTFSVPEDATAGTDQYEIYRTVQSADVSTTPDADYFLVARVDYSSGASVSYADDTVTDDDLIDALYTNPNSGGDGTLAANYRPIYATDVAVFADTLFMSNTHSEHTIDLTMIGMDNLVDDTSSITLTTNALSGVTYTFSASENVGTRKFRRYTSGTSAENIRDTMRSFVRVVNQDRAAGARWYAEYVSGVNEAPGQMRIWNRALDTDSFAVTCNHANTGANFSPVLPTSGTTVVSDNDAAVNRIVFSKLQQPEAVPLTYTRNVGRSDKAIERIIALRGALFAIKEDGIFYITGSTAEEFSVTTRDGDALIVAPDTACAMFDAIFCLTNQGVVQFSQNSIQVISNSIESDLNEILSFSNLRETAFAAAFPTDRHYILWLPLVEGDTYARQAYVYNYFTKQWTRWLKPATCAYVMAPQRHLYVGSGIENKILKQRTANSNADYSDESVDVTITAVSGTSITLTYSSPIAAMTNGFSLHQGASFAKITAVTSNGANSWTCTIDRSVTFTTGAATVRVPIFSEFRMAPDGASESGVSKVYVDATILLDGNVVSQCTMSVGTNQNGYLHEQDITRDLANGWGLSAWGSSIWGDSDPTLQTVPLRMDFPLGYNTGELSTVGMSHHVSQEPFQVAYVMTRFSAESDAVAARDTE